MSRERSCRYRACGELLGDFHLSIASEMIFLQVIIKYIRPSTRYCQGRNAKDLAKELVDAVGRKVRACTGSLSTECDWMGLVKGNTSSRLFCLLLPFLPVRSLLDDSKSPPSDCRIIASSTLFVLTSRVNMAQVTLACLGFTGEVAFE